jgi:hypothetical protein
VPVELVALITAVSPAQILPEPEIDITGVVYTVIFIVTVSAHPLPLLPITVYVVVDAGNAITEDPVVPISELPGVHVYVAAPLADKIAELPAQIAVSEAEIDTTGAVQSGFNLYLL